MPSKSAHPDQLFEYLNGAVDAEAARKIEAHLCDCADCTSLAALVRSLKQSSPETESEGRSEISNLTSQISNLEPQNSNLKLHISREHPDTSELASFYYARSKQGVDSRVATHVALCRSCGEEIAQYARAESAASHYNPTVAACGEVPAKAWEMIRDWEDSSFAKLRPASEALGQELLNRLARLLSQREVRRLARKVSRTPKAHQTDSSGGHKGEVVPVLVVNSSGEMRRVELFERTVDSSGASVLKHAEGSKRFDDKPVHLLLDFGEEELVVASDLIRRGTIRLNEQRSGVKPRRADYFIVDD